jgi:single-strand DNA-binding protein
MASLNQVTIIGNLGRDPETRTFPSGDQICNVTIATTDKWKDKQSGEMREATEWHRVVFNGRTAEIAAQYLRKGSQVCVQGSIRTRKYTDKDGVEKFATDIRADNLVMLGSGGDRAPAAAPRAAEPAPAPKASGGGFEDDDIPFAPMGAGRLCLAM